MEKEKKYNGGEGLARICYEFNTIYEGVLKKGKKEGYGRLIFNDGSRYEGLFENDCF